MTPQPIGDIPKTLSKGSLIKFMLFGGGIAFAFIALVVFSVEYPNPAWGNWWVIRPLLVTPLVCSLGGGFVYIMSILPCRNEWIKFLLLVMGIIGYIISLWMGSILGLVGTLWN